MPAGERPGAGALLRTVGSKRLRGWAGVFAAAPAAALAPDAAADAAGELARATCGKGRWAMTTQTRTASAMTPAAIHIFPALRGCNRSFRFAITSSTAKSYWLPVSQLKYALPSARYQASTNRTQEGCASGWETGSLQVSCASSVGRPFEQRTFQPRAHRIAADPSNGMPDSLEKRATRLTFSSMIRATSTESS